MTVQEWCTHWWISGHPIASTRTTPHEMGTIMEGQVDNAFFEGVREIPWYVGVSWSICYFFTYCYAITRLLFSVEQWWVTGLEIMYQFLLGFLVFAFFEEPYSLFTLHTGPKVQEKSSGFQVCRKEQDKTALGFPLSWEHFSLPGTPENMWLSSSATA